VSFVVFLFLFQLPHMTSNNNNNNNAKRELPDMAEIMRRMLSEKRRGLQSPLVKDIPVEWQPLKSYTFSFGMAMPPATVLPGETGYNAYCSLASENEMQYSGGFAGLLKQAEHLASLPLKHPTNNAAAKLICVLGVWLEKAADSNNQGLCVSMQVLAAERAE